MIDVKLSIGTVQIIDKLTWGQKEEIQSAMLGGLRITGLTDKDKQDFQLDPAVVTKAKYKTLEVCIKKITLSDGKEVAYSKEWMDNLSIEDGDILFQAVDEVTNPKKK